MDEERVVTIIIDGIGTVSGKRTADLFPHLGIMTAQDDFISSVGNLYVVDGLGIMPLAVVEYRVGHQLLVVFVKHLSPSRKPHLVDAGVVVEGVGIHLVLRAGHLHGLEKTQFLEVIPIKADLADEFFVASGGHPVVGITGQMSVAVIGHVLRHKQGGVVHHAHIVEELGKTAVTIILHGAAVHVNAVVHTDVDVLECIETVAILIVVGAVAIEMGAVVTDMHLALEDHGIQPRLLMKLVGVFDMDQRTLMLGLLRPSHERPQHQG